MAYQPNFTDRRVIKRITKAVEFIEQYVFATPVPVAKSQIIKHFGQAQTDISKYLKQHLLVCVDPYFNFETHICKKYVRNQDGLTKLKQSIGLQAVALTPQLQQQLDTGEFEYTEKSDRFFNPIQYKPRRIKRPLLAANGYVHNYDIVCAAPTLFYQYAQRLKHELKLPAIEQYLADRTAVRDDLSVKYAIPVDQVKQIITGLFQGAHLSVSHNTRIYHILNGDYTKIRRLQSDTYLTELRRDISAMWKVISPDLKQQYNKTRLCPKDKAKLYRELEREVITAIKRELRRTKNQFLLEHDGWSCRDVVDINWLRTCVRSKTGYVIDIDWEMYE
jgi:hypothetical protein